MEEQAGYAGRILKVDLSSGNIAHLATRKYSERFLGGRGIAAKLYWDRVSPEVRAFDAQNRLIMVTGPLAGFAGLAGSRWQICGKSAASTPHHFSYCNLGGNWGVELKFAGYDAVVIDGTADKLVYVLVEDSNVEIRDASHLRGKGAIETREQLKAELGKSARVLTVGPAGEKMVVFATLLADEDSSGSGGLGAVFGAKNLKAVVVRRKGKKELKAAHPEKLNRITQQLRSLVKLDVPWQPWTTTTFTGFQVKRKPCWGCIAGCMRGTYASREGQPGKFMCQSGAFYKMALGRDYERPSAEVAYGANKLCDEHGVDTWVMQPIIQWLIRCHRAGVLDDASTGLSLSKIGTLEFVEGLIRKISAREGFGDLLADGLTKAAEIVGGGAKDLLEGRLSRAGEYMAYEPRLYITTGLLYAMEPRRAMHLIHEIAEPVGQWLLCNALKQGYYTTDVLRRIGKRFLGSELAFDFSTYEGKAPVAARIQDREYAKESLILCDMIWPIAESEDAEDHVGDPTLESKTLSSVTGMEIDEEGLYRFGERIFNMQRAVLVREGHKGRESDTLPEFFFTTPLESAPENPKCLLPGRGGEVISRKGEVVDREKFEQMKTEYYQLRGWDKNTGFQTKAKLKQLGLTDIAFDLEKRSLTD